MVNYCERMLIIDAEGKNLLYIRLSICNFPILIFSEIDSEINSLQRKNDFLWRITNERENSQFYPIRKDKLVLNRYSSVLFKTNAVFTKTTTQQVNREITRQNFTYLVHWIVSRMLNRKVTLLTHCSLQLWSKYRQSTQLGGTNSHFVLAVAMTLLTLVKGLGTKSVPLLYTAQGAQTVRVCKQIHSAFLKDSK